MYLELIKKIRDDRYVRDLVTEGERLREIEKMRFDSIELFVKGGFKLTKSQSNEPNLEISDLRSQTKFNFEK